MNHSATGTTNIIIAAIGGQGAVVASRIIAQAAFLSGADVKISETHGMSQRGGSIVAHVRYGEKISSPVVETGKADCVISMEQIEGARYASWLKPNGTLITSTQRIDPVTVQTGSVVYPMTILEDLVNLGINVSTIDAPTLACKAGSIKAINVVLAGAYARTSSIKKEYWIEAVSSSMAEKYQSINLKGFELGWNAISL